MSSLYIHIPFCHHKCLYCSFYSVAQKYDTNLYVERLIKELCERQNFIDNNLQTIYFGGGTPSLLSLTQIEKILLAIENTYSISNVKETTFEINPENADKEYLIGLKNLGINRLSIGIESFDAEDLRLLNRSHTSLQAKQSIENAINTGFENISIDLICNLPFSSFEKWKNNLQTFINYDLTHISCYTLMIETGTMLEKLIQKGKYNPVSEEYAIKEFDYTMQTLEKHNYLHYETSSYAKHGYKSQHNLTYWTFQPYLGIGAGAHSYNGKVRQWNKNDINGYFIGNILQSENLTTLDKYHEYIMLSARMQNGLNKSYVQNHFPEFYNKFSINCNSMIQQGFLNNDLSLTSKGWHLQDTLILELCSIE